MVAMLKGSYKKSMLRPQRKGFKYFEGRPLLNDCVCRAVNERHRCKREQHCLSVSSEPRRILATRSVRDIRGHAQPLNTSSRQLELDAFRG